MLSDHFLIDFNNILCQVDGDKYLNHPLKVSFIARCIPDRYHCIHPYQLLYHPYQLKHEIAYAVQGLHWCRWYKIVIPWVVRLYVR